MATRSKVGEQVAELLNNSIDYPIGRKSMSMQSKWIRPGLQLWKDPMMSDAKTSSSPDATSKSPVVASGRNADSSITSLCLVDGCEKQK